MKMYELNIKEDDKFNIYEHEFCFHHYNDVNISDKNYKKISISNKDFFINDIKKYLNDAVPKFQKIFAIKDQSDINVIIIHQMFKNNIRWKAICTTKQYHTKFPIHWFD